MQKNVHIDFEGIRPYRNEEIPKAMLRITQDELFPLLASFVYPNAPIDKIRHQIASYKTIREFQAKTMAKVNERIIDSSTDGFSCSGLERLSPDENYLYVSNHRDIVLDASFLQHFLLGHGFDTTEITFGSNLMTTPLVIDIGKSNKMFRVERPSKDIRDFYKNSQLVSDYIRHTILNKHQSVWIAQRNGRTKDGNDVTDQGIIKMFCMSGDDNKSLALEELNIVPMSISYEWESCDILKTIEVYESKLGDYIKKSGEDLNSILTGITQQKGRVHIELCEPISADELSKLDSLSGNEYYKAIAELIDKRIRAAYRLYPNNYIAYDIRHAISKFSDRYDRAEKEEFLFHLRTLERYGAYDIKELKDIYLGIYSNPLENKLKMVK